MADDKLTKSDLVNEIADNTGLTKADVTRVLNQFQDSVIAGVSDGKKVSLSKFITLAPAVRAARTMKNPQTGEDLKVPEKRVVKVKALKSFNDAVA